jgi:phosphoinositide-3-kinase regulatory subunit 4
MISLDPSARPTFNAALDSCRASVFPESFYSFLHEYVSNVNELTAPSVFSKPVNAPNSSEVSSAGTASTAPPPAGPTPTVSTITTAPPANNAGQNPGVATYESMLPNESDARIDRLWNDFAMLEPHLLVLTDGEEAEKRPDKATGRTRTMPFQVRVFAESRLNETELLLRQDILPVELSIPKRTSRLQGGLLPNQRAASEGKSLTCLAQTLKLNCTGLRRPCSNRALSCLLQCAQLHNPKL